jgi:hypothetical protein
MQSLSGRSRAHAEQAPAEEQTREGLSVREGFSVMRLIERMAVTNVC